MSALFKRKIYRDGDASAIRRRSMASVPQLENGNINRDSASQRLPWDRVIIKPQTDSPLVVHRFPLEKTPPVQNDAPKQRRMSGGSVCRASDHKTIEMSQINKSECPHV
jgi:hypothetical protein